MMMLELVLCAFCLAPQEPQGEVQREELANGMIAVYEVQMDSQGNPIRHGSLTVHDSQGRERVLGEYTSGKRSGRWRFRYENRKPMAIGMFKNGSRSGKWTFKRANGERHMEGKYVRGRPKGKWRFWTEDGEEDPIHTGTYDWLFDVDLVGGLRGSGPTLDGSLHGNWEVTWPNGRRQLEATFHRGERSGTWSFWHVDGTFDDEFLSGNHGPDTWDPAIVRDPISLELPPESDALVDGDGPPDPAAIADQLDCDGVDPGVRRDYESYSQGESSPEELLDSATPAQRENLLRLALEELQGLDFETASDLERARRLNSGLVMGILDGRAVMDPDVSKGDALRLAALRLHSLHAVTAAAPDWWEFDLDMGLDAAGWPSSSLLKPTIHVEALFGLSSEGGLYASRFARRDPLAKEERKALDLALEWLVEHQDADGKWDSDEFTKHCESWELHGGPGQMEHDVGVTGLAMLALMGDGNSTGFGPYRDNVLRAAKWLCSQQDTENGLLGNRMGHTFLYDHAIATLALSELCAQSNSQGLSERVKLAVKLITRARNAKGVWRYEVPPTNDNDTSITGWMVLALVAASEAGLAVDGANFNYALDWIDRVTEPLTGSVGYSARGEHSARTPDLNDQYPQKYTDAMTAVALHCRHVLGQDPGKEGMMQKHAQLIAKKLPIWDPGAYKVDHYYWFHAAYAMHYLEGGLARAWRKSLVAALLEGQQEGGSWPPVGAWGHAGGRVYSTALCALMLEAPKRHSRIPRAH